MKIPVEEQYKFVKLSLPDGSKAEGHEVLLHACCAPCSSAIVECMLRNGMKPTVYFSNSNIYPLQEFEIRKHELMRFLEAMQTGWNISRAARALDIDRTTLYAKIRRYGHERGDMTE